MQKNLGARVDYQIPEAAKQALALAQRQAGSDMPYQKSMQNAMDLQQAKALGGATRAATSSQDLLGMMTNLGEKGMEQQQDIGMAAGQRYDTMQGVLQNALGTMAGYQERQRADQQQNWYEKAQAAAAMRGAGMQNTLGGLMGAGQAAASTMALKSDANQTQALFDSKNQEAKDLTHQGMQNLADVQGQQFRKPSLVPVRTNIPGPVAEPSATAMPFSLDEANQQLLQSNPRAAAIMDFMQKQLTLPKSTGSAPIRSAVGPIDWNNQAAATNDDARQQAIMQLLQQQFTAQAPSATPFKNPVGPIDWGNQYSEPVNPMEGFIGQMFNPTYVR